MASIQIKSIPQETYKFILQVQTEMKIKKKRGQYSQSLTVINILDECKTLREELKAKERFSVFNK